MNNFETAPETLFSGSMKWYGVKNPVMKTFRQMREQDRHGAMGEWPSIISDKSPKSSIFCAHLIRQLVVCDSSALDDLKLTQEAVMMQFAKNKFIEWLPPEEIDNAWLGEGNGSVGNWWLIGVAEHIALSAFARQFWQPSLTYGDGDLSSVSMHVKPLATPFAEQIAKDLQ